jgi:hypothetical protein
VAAVVKFPRVIVAAALLIVAVKPTDGDSKRKAVTGVRRFIILIVWITKWVIAMSGAVPATSALHVVTPILR